MCRTRGGPEAHGRARVGTGERGAKRGAHAAQVREARRAVAELFLAAPGTYAPPPSLPFPIHVPLPYPSSPLSTACPGGGAPGGARDARQRRLHVSLGAEDLDQVRCLQPSAPPPPLLLPLPMSLLYTRASCAS